MQPIVTKTIKQQTVIETKKQNFIKTTKLNSTNSIIKPSAQIQQRKSLQQAKKTMNNKPTGQQQVNSIRIVANQKNDLVTKLQPTVNLNKDILVQPSTKFITMTSKIQQQQQQPVKCQTITPTTNKPVINQEEVTEPNHTDEKNELSIEQLQTNEINLICENNVFIF
jgi:hypothetical protein